MNRLAAILPVSNMILDAEITSKKRAFEELGLLFENQHGLARVAVTDSLFARERLGSTGLGHGVAIPHGRIKGLKEPQAALLRLRSPIGFDAPDGEPVSLIISLLIPQNNAQQHLEILSDIAQILGNEALREQIKTVAESASLYALLQI
ncbi:MAG: PTS sugar transporter subunit IIA [Brachymonas sp.]